MFTQADVNNNDLSKHSLHFYIHTKDGEVAVYTLYIHAYMIQDLNIYYT